MNWLLLPILLLTSPIHQERYLLHKGRIDQAFALYRTESNREGKHDFELLEELALGVIKQGVANNDTDAALLALFGAGVSAHERMIPHLAAALHRKEPRLQLVALHFLTKLGNEEGASYILKVAKTSPPLLQLEAIHSLILLKHPSAKSRLEAFMAKSPPPLRPLYPSLFAKLSTPDAAQILRQFLADPNQQVRIEACLAIAESSMDNLLPQIRSYAHQMDPRESEAAAFALGALQDGNSTKQLQHLLSSPHANVRIAAGRALVQLGREEGIQSITKLAQKGNPFALIALGDVEGAGNLLHHASKSKDPLIKLNATIALLEKRDPRCLPSLIDILLADPGDVLFEQVFSPGRSIHAWRPLSNTLQDQEKLLWAKERSTAFREHLLWMCSTLPQDDFIHLAEILLNHGPRDLIPQIIACLEKTSGDQVIPLLTKYSEKVGDPLVRTWCSLSLYRLGHKEFGLATQKWAWREGLAPLIQLRPLLPHEMALNGSSPHITAEQRSRLLLEIVESFTDAHEKIGIDTLLALMEKGNPKNRYALAGLLLRAIE